LTVRNFRELSELTLQAGRNEIKTQDDGRLAGLKPGTYKVPWGRSAAGVRPGTYGREWGTPPCRLRTIQNILPFAERL